MDIPECAYNIHIIILQMFIPDIANLISTFYFQIKYRILRSNYYDRVTFVPTKDRGIANSWFNKLYFRDWSDTFDYDVISTYFGGTCVIFDNEFFAKVDFEHITHYVFETV